MILLGRLVALFLFFAWSPSVFAQSFESMMNKIVRSTPGITNVAISSGVRTAATGTVGVEAAGLTIPVATTVSADIGAAAITGAAARVALRAVPWIGAAVLVADVVGMVKGSNIVACPPPDFFCKTAAAGSAYQVRGTPSYRQANSDGGDSGVQSTVAAACAAFVASRTAIHASTDKYVYSCVSSTEDPNPSDTYQWKSNGSLVSSYVAGPADVGTTYTCPDGKVQAYNNPICTITNTTTTTTPATADDINTQLTAAANVDRNATLRLKAELDAITQSNPAMAPPIDITAAPLTVTAPPVTSPSRVVSTSTIPNADGTTSTQTVTQQTTVSPVVGTPSTIVSPNISYPSTTTTTTTTINNSTNVKNITTIITNNPPPVITPAKPDTPTTTGKPTDLPTDYNREVTQQKILNVLNGDGMPTAALKSADGAITSIDTQNKTDFAGVSAITDSSLGLFNWFPSFPTAQCVNPQVPNPLTGAMVDVVICDKVSMISLMITGVIAAVCLFGCVGEVSAALKT